MSRTSISHICITLLSTPSDDKALRPKQNGQHITDNILGFFMKIVVVSFKCHWICLQCAIDNMSVFFNIMAWFCAGAKSETMLPMFCDSIYGVT